MCGSTVALILDEKISQNLHEIGEIKDPRNLSTILYTTAEPLGQLICRYGVTKNNKITCVDGAPYILNRLV